MIIIPGATNKIFCDKNIEHRDRQQVQTLQQFDETIDHIISACPILAKEQYIERHDRVCAQLHFNICKETGVELDKKQWYEHVPKSVETS